MVRVCNDFGCLFHGRLHVQVFSWLVLANRPVYNLLESCCSLLAGYIRMLSKTPLTPELCLDIRSGWGETCSCKCRMDGSQNVIGLACWHLEEVWFTCDQIVARCQWDLYLPATFLKYIFTIDRVCPKSIGVHEDIETHVCCNHSPCSDWPLQDPFRIHGTEPSVWSLYERFYEHFSLKCNLCV